MKHLDGLTTEQIRDAVDFARMRGWRDGREDAGGAVKLFVWKCACRQWTDEENLPGWCMTCNTKIEQFGPLIHCRDCNAPLTSIKGGTVDEATKVFAEALFKSGYSDPHADSVDRAWMAVERYAGYREGIVRGLLRDSGYDVVKLDA